MVYYKLIFYYGFRRVQSPTCTICRERHLKKENGRADSEIAHCKEKGVVSWFSRQF